MEYDGWMFPKELYDWVVENIPEGSTILEFGSGNGTDLLLEKFNVISIEHDEKWAKPKIGKYNHIMIYAPIVNCVTKGYDDERWYNFKIIKRSLVGMKYNAIIIDGPTGKHGRAGIVKYRKEIKMDVPIIIDDLQKLKYEQIFMELIDGDRHSEIISAGENRKFGVIL